MLMKPTKVFRFGYFVGMTDSFVLRTSPRGRAREFSRRIVRIVRCGTRCRHERRVGSVRFLYPTRLHS